MKPCMLLARMQPMHLGHQALIQQIINKGYQPILVLGEANELSERNPYDFHTRHCMIKRVYPDIPMGKVLDATSWDAWMENFHKVYHMIADVYGEPLLAVHNKPEDLQDIHFRGELRKSIYYSQLIAECGVELLQLEPTGIDIRATTIRNDLEGNKQFLHPMIYEYLITD